MRLIACAILGASLLIAPLTAWAQLPAPLARESAAQRWIVLGLWPKLEAEVSLSWRIDPEHGAVVDVQGRWVEAAPKKAQLVVEVKPDASSPGAVRVRVGVQGKRARRGPPEVAWASGEGWIIDPLRFDPYRRFRDGDAFVHQRAGVRWLCPASAAKLCRVALMPMSYPELGARLRLGALKGVVGAKDAAQALEQVARAGEVGADGARRRLKVKSSAKGKALELVGMRRGRWLMARRLGARWVYCELSSIDADGRLNKATLKQAKAICARLEDVAGEAVGLDCQRQAERCRQLCASPGQGAACVGLGTPEALHQGCALGDGASCEALSYQVEAAPLARQWAQRACALGHAAGCVRAATLAESQAQVKLRLAEACGLDDAAGCAQVASWCMGAGSCEGWELRFWARRACALGGLGWCRVSAPP